VVVPLAYQGTLWEIDWLSSTSLLSRTVFVMPPSRSSGHDYGPEWDRGIATIADLGITVPPYRPEGGTFLYRNADLTTPLFCPTSGGYRPYSACAFCSCWSARPYAPTTELIGVPSAGPSCQRDAPRKASP
jgi:hypothetical protein